MTKYFLASILCILGFAAQAEAASPISAYEFFKPSENQKLALSPSGEKIAYIWNKTGSYCLDAFGQMEALNEGQCDNEDAVYRTIHEVIIYDIAANKSISRIPVPKNYSSRWLEWVTDERLLTAISGSTTMGRDGKYVLGGSRILSLKIPDSDAETVETTVLFGDEKGLQKQNRNLSRLTNVLRHDPDHIIMPAVRSGELDLWKVNVTNGSVERIALGGSGTFYWYTDNAGNPTLRFDCNGSRCRKIIVYTPSEEDEGDWDEIHSFKVKPDEDEGDYDFWPIAPTDNPHQIYVLSDEEEDERRSIKLYDIEEEKYIQTVFEHPNVDVRGAIKDGRTGDYLGAWFYEDRLNYAINNERLQKHYNAINKFFSDEANVSLVGYNADASKAVVFVSSTNSPGGYYVYDFATSNLMLIFHSEPALQAHLKTRTDIIKISTRDGSTITAYHSYPEGEDPSDLPLLVMPHGGPEARDFYNYDTTDQYFTVRGYQTLRVNFRGSSGFGKKFAEAGYGQWGGLMQDDVTDTVEYFYEKKMAQPNNTCIVGYSYGGFVALHGAAMTPGLYRCVVSGGGVSDLNLSLKNTRKDYGKKSETYDYWQKSVGDAKRDEARLEANSPITHVDKIIAPTLLIHAEHDEVVYPEQSEEMFEALEDRNMPVEYLELEGEGHNNWSLKSEILYHETVETFLEKHLTGQKPLN